MLTQLVLKRHHAHPVVHHRHHLVVIHLVPAHGEVGAVHAKAHAIHGRLGEALREAVVHGIGISRVGRFGLGWLLSGCILWLVILTSQ